MSPSAKRRRQQPAISLRSEKARWCPRGLTHRAGALKGSVTSGCHHYHAFSPRMRPWASARFPVGALGKLRRRYPSHAHSPH